MNTDELKTILDDTTAFLKALDKTVPGRVDPEFISFLEQLQSHPWNLTMLAQSLAMAKVLDAKNPTKR